MQQWRASHYNQDAMLSFVEITDSFTVSSSREPVSFAPDIEAQVDAIWARAVEENPDLFDGTILHVAASDRSGLRCRPVSYRFFYAQQKERSLRPAMRLVTVGVSGLVRLQGKVLVGTRAPFVTQCPNLFELVPSGSLPAPAETGDWQQIDYCKQLLTEFYEETGIAEDFVDTLEPFLLVRDEFDAVVDICCSIILKKLDVLTLLDRVRSAEYADLELISWHQVMSMVNTAPELWVSASRLMITHLGNCG